MLVDAMNIFAHLLFIIRTHTIAAVYFKLDDTVFHLKTVLACVKFLKSPWLVICLNHSWYNEKYEMKKKKTGEVEEEKKDESTIK